MVDEGIANFTGIAVYNLPSLLGYSGGNRNLLGQVDGLRGLIVGFLDNGIASHEGWDYIHHC